MDGCPNRFGPKRQSTHQRKGWKDRCGKESLAQPGDRRVSSTQNRSTRHEDSDVHAEIGTPADPITESKRNSKRGHEETCADRPSAVTFVRQWIETRRHCGGSRRETTDGDDDGCDPVTGGTGADQQQSDPTAEQGATGRECCKVEQSVIRPIRCSEVARCLLDKAVSVSHQSTHELRPEVEHRSNHSEPEQHDRQPAAHRRTGHHPSIRTTADAGIAPVLY